MEELATQLDDSSDQPVSCFERLILAFERSWQADSEPRITEFVDKCEAVLKGRLSRELVLIDMEFRWQAKNQRSTKPESSDEDETIGWQPTWSIYAGAIPLVGALGAVPADLVAEEYRIRHLWGDRPNHDRFISAYPAQLTLLPKCLARIDEELRADGVSVRPAASPQATATFDPRAPLPWTDYLLQEHLGSGGFGKVYRAVQKSLGRDVAIKALHKDRQQDSLAVEQFIQEARLLARMNHPGIIGVHGLGRFPGGGYFLVLDLVDGVDLQHSLDEGPIAVEEAVRVTKLVAEAVQHAHDNGVIHGDLKPSNVLLNRQRCVSVTDFGMAVLLNNENARGAPRIRGGTVAYLAPEVARGDPVDVAVDVYGLGALLYALLTSHPPQLGRGGPLSCPSATNTAVPARIDTIVMKCLDVNAVSRFSTALDVATALRGSEA